MVMRLTPSKRVTFIKIFQMEYNMLHLYYLMSFYIAVAFKISNLISIDFMIPTVSQEPNN